MAPCWEYSLSRGFATLKLSSGLDPKFFFPSGCETWESVCIQLKEAPDLHNYTFSGDRSQSLSGVYCLSQSICGSHHASRCLIRCISPASLAWCTGPDGRRWVLTAAPLPVPGSVLPREAVLLASRSALHLYAVPSKRVWDGHVHTAVFKVDC